MIKNKKDKEARKRKRITTKFEEILKKKEQVKIGSKKKATLQMTINYQNISIKQ